MSSGWSKISGIYDLLFLSAPSSSLNIYLFDILSISQKNGCNFYLLKLYFCYAKNVAAVLLALQ